MCVGERQRKERQRERESLVLCGTEITYEKVSEMNTVGRVCTCERTFSTCVLVVLHVGSRAGTRLCLSDGIMCMLVCGEEKKEIERGSGAWSVYVCMFLST